MIPRSDLFLASLAAFVCLRQSHSVVYAARAMKRYMSGLSAVFFDAVDFVEISTMCAWYRLRARIILRRKPKVVLFYPNRPKIMHFITTIFCALGYRITNDPKERADIYVSFEDTTIRTNDAFGERLLKEHNFINGGCADVSKEHVEKIFQEVFGYGMAVDQRVHRGECVRKSNKNAVHDGAVVECPREPEEGYIYQRLINNRFGEDMVADIRILIVGGSILTVKLRYKRLNDRFDHTLSAEYCKTEDHLRPDEVEKVLEFCKRFGLDFGELDALRDNDDGRLYIVDANNTPYSCMVTPYNSLHRFLARKREYVELVYKTADLLESKFLAAK